MKYAIFDLTSGRIKRVVACDPDGIGMQLQPGDSYTEMGEGDDSTHYVADGEFVAIPVQPSTDHTFDWTAKAWVDPRTLEDHRQLKWEEMKAERTAHNLTPLTTPYGVFDADADSQIKMTNAAAMLQVKASRGEPFSVDFTLADNTVVLLDVTEMENVGLALGARSIANHETSRVLRVQIWDATTIAEVEAITWPV
jgi:hypothetical protein